MVVAIVESPSDEDPFWLVSAPAISYSAQGETRDEALRRFEETLDEATEWAIQNGVDIATGRHPDIAR